MRRPTIQASVLCGALLLGAAVLLGITLSREASGLRNGHPGGEASPAFRSPVPRPGPPPAVHVIAHRGANRLAPENTLAAFRRAAELGARAVECDVVFTADDVPVVAHHEDLGDRVPPQHRPARIDEMTLEQLKRLDAGAWFSEEFRGEPFPTLGEALGALQGFERVYLHDKHTNDYRGRRVLRLERFIAEIRRSGMMSRVIVMVESGFERDWLRLAPEMALMKCWIEPADGAGPAGLETACRSAFAAGFRHFGIEHDEDQGLLNAAQAEVVRSAVSRYKGLGCGFAVFTVNRAAAIEQFRALGFTGIGTDEVASGLALLENQARHQSATK
jgi:glycerophosphoryl diester phosphodiesterase